MMALSMPLQPGVRLGPYEVIELIGVGGMGEVYRARDTKLGRDVALKLLPPEFTADADRVARFQREARLLASLNHPCIGAIYGLDETDGVLKLVLELIEGETLAQRVRRRPLRVAEALSVARQVADAVATAHDAGIVHRDLKPANIKLTVEGVAKVFDFGLAKVQVEEAGSAQLTQTPTVTADRTSVGTVMGTVAYMSPEQARGLAVDRRTDLWAFGCVLYEMLTGRPPFHGDTIADTMAGILQREPDWGGLPAGLPASVRWLIQRCLEKDPRRRLRDMADARHWLEDVPDSEVETASASRPGFHPRLVWLLGGAVLASAAFAAWLVRTSASPTVRDVQHQRLTDFVGMEESPALAPDGKTVVFVARAGGRSQLWLRLLAGGAPLQITRDDVDHEQPRWTPDSSALIYFEPSATPGEHGTIWEISALGGPPRRVTPALSGGDISHDGRRIALIRFEGGHIALVVVSRDGTDTEVVKPLPPGSIYEYPRWSPDDRWIAYQQDILSVAFDERVFVTPADGTGDSREIARSTDVKGLSWRADGSGVVFSSAAGGSVLYPPPFNLKSVNRDGTGTRQVTFGDESYGEPDLHASGIVVASRSRMQSDIWKFGVHGTPLENTRTATRITYQTGQAQTPSVSPDDSEVAYLSDSGGHGNLWIAQTDGSGVRQMTFERDPSISIGAPLWSPLGHEVAFIVNRSGVTGLAIINRDGSGLRQLVPRGYSAAWSADGRWLYYSRNTGETNCIEKVPLDGGSVVPVRCENSNSSAPHADGSSLFHSNLLIKDNGIVDHEIGRATPENGPSQILARVSGSRVAISRRHLVPVLSPDGRWLTMPLRDGSTSNIWLLPTGGGALRPLTDFGDRSVIIARSVSWSRDGSSIYGAVADTDSDIVLLDGLLP
jgi:Tol biopolymer transport system component